jgi:hypothetical protein
MPGRVLIVEGHEAVASPLHQALEAHVIIGHPDGFAQHRKLKATSV